MERRARRTPSERFAIGVAVGSVLLLTLIAAGSLRSAEQDADQARLDGSTASLASVLRIELERLADAGTDAGVALSLVPELDTEQFGELLTLLAVEDRFPGVFGVSFIEWVPRGELDRFLLDLRGRVPGFEITSDGGEDLLRLVTFSHPLPDNAPVIGVDLSPLPDSRRAADRARETHAPALSDATVIVQLAETVPGAVIHAPVPSRDGRPEATIGMVFSGQQFVERLEPLPRDVGILVVDPVSPTFNRLAEVGDHRPDAALTSELDVTAVGNTWRLSISASPGFTPPWYQRGSTALSVGGLLASVFAGLFVRSLAGRERLATDLVAKRTAELSHANEQLAGLNDDLATSNDALEDSNLALAEANQTKDAFLASVSHELRTPLTVIAGFVDAMQRMPPEDRSSERFLDPIQRNVRRLDALVSDLLTLASLDAGGVRAFRRPVDLATLLPDLPATLVGMKSEVTVDVAPGCVVEIDPRHLDRILVNLLVNAERHGSPPIVLRARPGSDDTVEIVVGDRGPGVRPDQVDWVFERFARGESRQNAPGTGLGLSIVRELAALNGGTVRYEDADPGARFIVRLQRPV